MSSEETKPEPGPAQPADSEVAAEEVVTPTKKPGCQDEEARRQQQQVRPHRAVLGRKLSDPKENSKQENPKENLKKAPPSPKQVECSTDGVGLGWRLKKRARVDNPSDYLEVQEPTPKPVRPQTSSTCYDHDENSTTENPNAAPVRDIVKGYGPGWRKMRIL